MRPASSHQRGGGQERWLLSYADFVTLLFALFVMMYAVSTVDREKLAPAASSMRAAFDGESRQPGPVPVLDGASVVMPPLPPARNDGMREALSRVLADALAEGRLELIEDAR